MTRLTSTIRVYVTPLSVSLSLGGSMARVELGYHSAQNLFARTSRPHPMNHLLMGAQAGMRTGIRF